MSRRIRCVLGMLASDKHSKGIRVLAKAFLDHGLEVIYMGEHNTAAQLADVAITEDADFVGVSFSTGDYLHRTAELVKELREREGAHVDVLVGGLIHREDAPTLVDEIGVAGVFGLDSSMPEILNFIDEKYGSAVAS